MDLVFSNFLRHRMVLLVSSVVLSFLCFFVYLFQALDNNMAISQEDELVPHRVFHNQPGSQEDNKFIIISVSIVCSVIFFAVAAIIFCISYKKSVEGSLLGKNQTQESWCQNEMMGLEEIITEGIDGAFRRNEPDWQPELQLLQRVRDIPVNDLMGMKKFIKDNQADFEVYTKEKYGDLGEQQVVVEIVFKRHVQKDSVQAILTKVAVISKLLLGVGLFIRPTIVIELVPQDSLEDLLYTQGYKCHQGSLGWKLKLTFNISKRMQNFHSKKVFHRDLRSSNIPFSDRDNSITKISDLGLTKIQQMIQTNNTTEHVDQSQLNRSHWIIQKNQHLSAEEIVQKLKSIFQQKHPSQVGTSKALMGKAAVGYGGGSTLSGSDYQHLIGMTTTSTPNGPISSTFKELRVPLGVQELSIPEDLKISCYLGRGTYGEVNKAVVTNQGKQKGIQAEYVAVKQFMKDCKTEEQLQAVLKEAKTMSKLQSEFTVKLYGIAFIKKGGYTIPCIVMEYVPDGCLSDLKFDGKSLLWKVKIFIDIAKGVEYLHSEKINLIHQDLKPQNILVDNSDRNSYIPKIKISDFGFSQIKEDSKSLSGGLAGTRNYMAPEQLYNRVDKPSDIWALGAVLQGCLVGQEPWKMKSPPEITNQMCLEKLTPEVINLQEKCELNELYQLILRCWKFEKESRPTATEIVKELEQIKDVLILQHVLIYYKLLNLVQFWIYSEIL